MGSCTISDVDPALGWKTPGWFEHFLPKSGRFQCDGFQLGPFLTKANANEKLPRNSTAYQFSTSTYNAVETDGTFRHCQRKPFGFWLLFLFYFDGIFNLFP